ncbi:outer membrane cobalamin receptor [Nitrosospira sp. Nsp5]|uniref:Outer membrane cobalamin receptor protein n=1 Tax=Nitrosospira multiformis TaxID=1231 RepID=A0ABY0T9X7_9PROT|nr:MULTISPECIES: TonB-dependent receptor [Nitrosospira]PTR08149.1 outer membrane cobalamin receptor [Nitrosospira sp. Nsp5]SDQ50383.1 Outer membrane cobalamin receptor protein [Nitrosospira multiformis]
MKSGRMLILGLIVNQAGLALANDVPKTILPELTIYGGNRIPMNQELTNLRINTVKLKVEDNDWKTVLQEQVQINELGPGGPVSLFMRGSNSNQTLFMIDGVKMYSATNGAPNFAAIAPGLLSSVDVIQGGTSAAFGSNAVGGVIRGNIDIPKGIMFSGGGGSRFSERAAGSFGVRGDSYYAGVRMVQDIIRQGSATNSNNPFAYNPDNDPRKRIGMVAKAGGWITPDFQVEATALGSQVKTSFDASPTTADMNIQSIAMANLRGIYSLPRDFSVMGTVGASTDNSTVRGAFPAVFNSHSLQASGQLEKKLNIGRIFTGIDYEIQGVNGTTNFTSTSRSNIAGFAGTQLDTGRHVVEGMFRHDDNSQFGDYNTYSVSLARKLGDSWRVGGLTSSSFKAPTFNDLYFPTMFGFGGNPNLKPERGRMHEAFVSYNGAGANYRFGYFMNTIKDAIVINNIFSQVENISEARIDGFEVSGTQPIGKNWTIRTNMTFQDPRNQQLNTILPRRSRMFGTVAMRYATENFMVEGIARGEGARYDDIENLHKLPAMVIVGFSASYKLQQGPTLRVQIDNLLDKKYQPAIGFNGIPRTVWGSITYTF